MKQSTFRGIRLSFLLLILLFVAPLLFGGGAQEPTVSLFPDSEVSFAYIPGQDFEVAGALQITQRSIDDQEYFIVADYGENTANCGGGAFDRCVSNPNNPTDVVQYELRNELGNVVRDLPDAGSSSQVISGTAPGNPGGLNFSTFTVPVSVFVQAGQLLDPNPAYEDNVSLRFYYGTIEDPGSYDPANPDGTATLTVLGNVAPFVELALVEPGGSLPFFGGTTSRTMDFGILEEGETQAYDLLVETNALFTITIESANGGVLTYQGTGPTGGLPQEVDYELFVNGQVADLSGGPTAFGSGLSGLRWPFVVEILEYDVPVAGDYQDVIDITVSTDQ